MSDVPSFPGKPGHRETQVSQNERPTTSLSESARLFVSKQKVIEPWKLWHLHCGTPFPSLDLKSRTLCLASGVCISVFFLCFIVSYYVILLLCSIL